MMRGVDAPRASRGERGNDPKHKHLTISVVLVFRIISTLESPAAGRRRVDASER
jgi:hypothetical protein